MRQRPFPSNLRPAPVCALIALLISVIPSDRSGAETLSRLQYNNPGLTADLGVGLHGHPLPLDFDKDGDLDIIMVCPDKPYNGTYFFENPGDGGAFPVFKPGVRIGPGLDYARVTRVAGEEFITTPNMHHPEFRDAAFTKGVKLSPEAKVHPNKTRANQWSVVDYDGDGNNDLMVAVGDWTEYGWDNAFDAEGRWTRGDLHGYIYLLRNGGTNTAPDYSPPARLQADGADIDVYGRPSPCYEDFDGDGDMDLLCGEFVDGFTYFENIGSRTAPRFAAGRVIQRGGSPLTMDLCMITPSALDWDADGDIDLIVGDEDGRVALIEHTGLIRDGTPAFKAPVYFRQQAADIKFGALVTPFSVDWDDDGDTDLICGNTAGEIAFIENLDGGNPPRWAEPVRLRAAGEVIIVQAGENGSIQGPCERKWGYTTLSVSDWDGDGLRDILVNSIWGKVIWYRNTGTPGAPKLAPAAPVAMHWNGEPRSAAWNWWKPAPQEFTTQWRTTPWAGDFDGDGLTDLVMLDHEGYLALFPRDTSPDGPRLTPGRRIFSIEGPTCFDGRHRVQKDAPENGLLRLNSLEAGKSGRRKFCFTDWDGDGRRDLLVNSENVHFLRNVAETAEGITYRDMGPVTDHILAGHTTSPTMVDWDADGRPDLLIGAEDGFLYYKPNPFAFAR